MIETVIETLTPPAAWTRGLFARTAKGNPIGPTEPNATCFCIAGAVIRAAEPGEPYRAMPFIEAAIAELFPGRLSVSGVTEFNDHPETTHADVLRVLQRARELELAAA